MEQLTLNLSRLLVVFSHHANNQQQMLDLVLWANSRGVFHCDLAADNFIIKGDSWPEVREEGSKPEVSLIDFGAAIVSPTVYHTPDPNSFVACYEDQWHHAASHGRLKMKDPFSVSRFTPLMRAQ